MTHLEKPPPFIPTEEERETYEQLMIDRGYAILADEEERNEWANR